MTGIEIKQQIDANNSEIERLVTPNSFILNNAVANLIQKNQILQNACPHEYEFGFCKYCYLQEPKE